MSDETDSASELEEQHRALAIAAARRAPAPLNTSHTPGECADGCGEKTAPGSIWCSVECRNAHEARARQMKRSGGA